MENFIQHISNKCTFYDENIGSSGVESIILNIQTYVYIFTNYKDITFYRFLQK